MLEITYEDEEGVCSTTIVNNQKYSMVYQKEYKKYLLMTNHFTGHEEFIKNIPNVETAFNIFAKFINNN